MFQVEMFTKKICLGTVFSICFQAIAADQALPTSNIPAGVYVNDESHVSIVIVSVDKRGLI